MFPANISVMLIMATFRRFAFVFAFAFFALQSAGLAHGYSYGDDPHEHNGIVCDIALAGDEAAVILPALPVVDIVITTTPAVYSGGIISAPARVNAPRAPPQRGPPAFI